MKGAALIKILHFVCTTVRFISHCRAKCLFLFGQFLNNLIKFIFIVVTENLNHQIPFENSIITSSKLKCFLKNCNSFLYH